MAVQAPATILFSLFYMVFCTGEIKCATISNNDSIIGFLCQFREFRGAGLSPEAFLSFGDWLGSEEIRWLQICCPDLNALPFFRFVRYHMKRTAGTLVLHSLLPIGTSKENIFVPFLVFQFTSWATPTFLLSWIIHTQAWHHFGK